MFVHQTEVKPMSAEDTALYQTATAHVLPWGPVPQTATYTPKQAAVISQMYYKYISPLGAGRGDRLYTSYVKNNPYDGGRRPTGAQAMHTILRWFIQQTATDNISDREAASLFRASIDAPVEYQQLLRDIWIGE